MIDKNLIYFEDLASTGIPCPHQDAAIPDGATVYYRYVKDGTVTSSSFLPTALKPDKPMPANGDDCILKSVSLFDDLQGLINAVFRVPSNRGKKKLIAAFCMDATDGRIKQTFGKHHHSWWRSKDFDFTKAMVKEIIV